MSQSCKLISRGSDSCYNFFSIDSYFFSFKFKYEFRPRLYKFSLNKYISTYSYYI